MGLTSGVSQPKSKATHRLALDECRGTNALRSRIQAGEMLGIGKLGAGAEDYYLSAVAAGREDYYLREGEAPGRWLGQGGRPRPGGRGRAPELRPSWPAAIPATARSSCAGPGEAARARQAST